ncbi:hypothetical protein DFS34DRAFT_400249 [Phlyctochytrium arcticum]|nr:hypothetical protein DFS34DRAFT_400249 [Phlyctochytrium arcticum]
MISGIAKISAAILAASALLGSVQAQQNPQNCIESTSFDATKDYFPVKATNVPASLFIITYNKSYKTIVDVRRSLTYVLYQCGAPIPSVTANATIPVPITRIAVGDTTALTFLEMLGVTNTIKYAPVNFLTSPCVQKAAPMDYGSGLNATGLANVDAVIQYANPPAGQTKLIRNAITSSTTSGERYPWIHLFAALYNKEDMGNDIATKIADDYTCLKNKGTALKTAAGGVGPTALTMNYYSSVWYLGSAYFNAYIADAGGRTSTGVTAGGSFNQAQLSAFDTTLRNTSTMWITGDIPTLSDFYNLLNITGLSASTAGTNYPWAGTNSLSGSGSLYNINKIKNALGSGTGWFEQAVAWENVVLADMIKTLWQSQNTPAGYTPTFMRDINSNAVSMNLTADMCKDTSKALQVPVVCSGQTVALSPNSALSKADGRMFAIALSVAAALASTLF